MTIWWEILYFSIKKYIRNSGKCDYLPGKNTFFPDLHKTSSPESETIIPQPKCNSTRKTKLFDLTFEPLYCQVSYHAPRPTKSFATLDQ